MTSLDALLAERVAAEVDRRAADLRRPELVTQRSVMAVCGMPAREFLRHCRAGHWPSWADRRLRYARTADVVTWVQAHPTPWRGAKGEDGEGRALRRVGARRVAQGAT